MLNYCIQEFPLTQGATLTLSPSIPALQIPLLIKILFRFYSNLANVHLKGVVGYLNILEAIELTKMVSNLAVMTADPMSTFCMNLQSAVIGITTNVCAFLKNKNRSR